MMTVLIDMDGVIADLLTPWCAAYNKKYNDDLTIDQFAKSWNVHSHVKCGYGVYDILNTPEFFAELKLHRDAYQGLNDLKYLSMQGKIRPVIVSCCGGIPNRASGKLQWLQTYAPWIIKDTIFCSDKSLVHGDIIIDDRVDVLCAWKAAHPEGHAILMSAPHNISVDEDLYDVSRYNSWRGIIDRLYCILGIAYPDSMADPD